MGNKTKRLSETMGKDVRVVGNSNAWHRKRGFFLIILLYGLFRGGGGALLFFFLFSPLVWYGFPFLFGVFVFVFFVFFVGWALSRGDVCYWVYFIFEKKSRSITVW